jgi:hypothetical protein
MSERHEGSRISQRSLTWKGESQLTPNDGSRLGKGIPKTFITVSNSMVAAGALAAMVLGGLAEVSR